MEVTMDLKDIKELKDYNGLDRVLTSFELQDILSHSTEPELRVKAKIPSLDRYLEGFEGGELIAISGPRKSGKTLLAQTLTINFLPIKSLWFSYELTMRQFLRAFTELPEFVAPLRLEIQDLTWMEKRIKEALLKYGIGVVFIDHLHFLWDMTKSKNPSLEIGSVVRRLKTMAIEYNLIIFLLCHMKKLSFDKEPDDSDVRDSSLVSSETDSGIILWRPKGGKDNEATVKIPYSRRTGVLDKTFKIVKVDGVLKELEYE
jgi:replicative DNA helicase